MFVGGIQMYSRMESTMKEQRGIYIYIYIPSLTVWGVSYIRFCFASSPRRTVLPFLRRT